MAVIIDISGGIDGTWRILDDGAVNGMSEVRDPNGTLFMTFAHPADAVTVVSRAGQGLIVNILNESLTTANFTVGSLASATGRPDVITIGAITTTTGIVTLTANQSIVEFSNDAAVDITAGTALLLAGSGMGSIGNLIETQVSVLEAESTTGGIFLGNFADLTIGGATGLLRGLFTAASGNIHIVNQGSITLADATGAESVHGAENVSLVANGTSSNLTSSVNLDAIWAGANLNVSAGQDVLFGTGGSNWDNDLRAGGQIIATPGRDFRIDGFSNLASNDLGLGMDGGVTITAGRNILIEDDFGIGASVGATAGAGVVTLTTGSGDTLSLAANSPSALFAGSGGVVVNADRVLIESDSGMTVNNGGSIRIAGATADRSIILGPVTDTVSGVELSDAELDRLFAATVIIGADTAGFIGVTGAISAAQDRLVLQSGNFVAVNSSIAAAGDLELRAANNVSSDSAGTVSASAFSVFVDTPDSDVAGGTSILDGMVSVVSSTITGNADDDTLGGTNANDTVVAGDGQDLILLSGGGNDTAMGEGGNDRIFFGAAMTGADVAIGGAGADSVILQGDYPSLTLGASSLQGIEIIRLLTGFDYVIRMHDGNVASGNFITVNATDLAAGDSLNFIGTAETNGRFVVNSGAGADLLVGGERDDQLNGNGGVDTLYGLAGDDILFGGAGGDTLVGGFDRDTFTYTSPSESTSLDFDRHDRFEPSRDSIDLPTAVTGWTGTASGVLSIATFDANLTAIDGVLQPNSAARFEATSGDYAGRHFAVVDANGDGNYTAGADYVFEFVAAVQPPEMTAAYFI